MKLLTAFFSIILTLQHAYSYTQQSFVYTSVTGDKSSEYTWTLEEKANRIFVTSVGNDTTVKMQARIPYQLEIFNSESPKKNKILNFTLNKNTLVATSTIKGVQNEKSYDIGSSPWVQEFEFGLKDFLKSSNSSFKFVILDPKTLDLHYMVAKKQGTESIEIAGDTIQALVVKITLTGFKSMFWKAMLWYDPTTFDLLVYKSNEGPHTPTTVVSLKSKKETVSSKS